MSGTFVKERGAYFSKSIRINNIPNENKVNAEKEDNIDCGKMFYSQNDIQTLMIDDVKLNIKEEIEIKEEPLQIKGVELMIKEEIENNQEIIDFSSERAFQSVQCDMAFSQNSGVSRHMIIHTGEKPYQCSQCDTAFSKNISLKKHMRKHTGS